MSDPEGTITWSRGDRSVTLPYDASGAEMHDAVIWVMGGEEQPDTPPPDHPGTV